MRFLREHRWRLVLAVFFVAALNYADRTSISAVFPLLRQQLGLTDLQLGGLGTAFLWTYALGSPIAGMAADRFPRGRVLLLSLAGWSLVTLFTGFTSLYWQLLATRIALGAAECFYLPAATALLADHHGTATRATAMGIHAAGLSLGLIGGGVAAGYLGDHYGWRPGFVILGAAGLVLCALTARVFLPTSSAARRQPAPPGTRSLASVPQDLRMLGGIPSFWIVAGKAMLSAIGIWIFLNWLPLYFRDTFRMSLAGAGFSGTFTLQAAAITGILLGGLCSDRLATRDRRYRMIFQGLCDLAAAPCVLLFLWTPSLALVSAAVFLFSLFRSLSQANENPLICDVVPAPLRSTAIGVTNLFNALAGGLGVLLTGLLKQRFSLSAIFASCGLFMLLAGILSLLGYRCFLARDLRRGVPADQHGA
ncbi:MAG: MFS transporter [Acidobacteria bacterium]|nr:MFS transporter [Acidobacteriota bacterium]